jgi:hypothetical protein
MSEAVSTYRRHADWSQRIADATPDQKDADVLRDRARRLSELADRFEREENERLPSQARPTDPRDQRAAAENRDT